MMSEEITHEQILKLAHEMVAAGNLNMLYGVDPFIKSKKVFEETLQAFVKQHSKDTVGTGSIQVTVPASIPDFLLKKQSGG